MDKENIKKLIIKFRSKLMPLAMALILTLGALLPTATAEAKEAPVYAKKLESGDSFDLRMLTSSYNSSGNKQGYAYSGTVSCSSPVYVIAKFAKTASASVAFGFDFVSENSFTLTFRNGKTWYSSIDDMISYEYTSGSTYDYSSSTGTYNNKKIYYYSLGGALSVDVSFSNYILYCSLPCVEFSYDTYGYFTNSTRVKWYYDLFSNNMQIGTETIEMNYAGSSSENIENVLGVFMNPYTGGADNTVSGVQNSEWSFLWKWTPPIDTSLTMEISADVEYTDSVIDNLLTAVKNSWKTVSVPLYPYEDGLEGAKGTVRFTYDFIKEKVAGQIGENPKKVRLKTVYFRYAKENEEGVVEYGQYTTFTPTYSSYMDVQPKVGVVSYPTGQYHSGVTERYDPITGTIPETSVNISGPDIDEAQGVEDFFGSVLSYLRSGTSFLEQFPLIMRDIFMSIPPQIMTMVTVSFGLLIALRIFGR